MENYYFKRIDWAEWFPGATAKVLQAIDEESGDLLVEIPMSSADFWALPGDEFEESDIDDDTLERVLTAYSEAQGD